MVLKSKNEGFTLVEVIVAVAVLTTALVLVTRSFASVMASTRLCQDIARACFLADEKMWQMQRLQAEANIPLNNQESTEGKFTVSFESKSLGANNNTYDTLVLMHERIAWKVREKEAAYPLDFYTYLFRKK